MVVPAFGFCITPFTLTIKFCALAGVTDILKSVREPSTLSDMVTILLGAAVPPPPPPPDTVSHDRTPSPSVFKN